MTNCNNSQNTATLQNKNDVPMSGIEASNTGRKRLLYKYRSLENTVHDTLLKTN